jgi:GNAT superfamily N-acetyltransferase
MSTDLCSSNLTIVKAQASDLDVYIDLLEAVADWLHSRKLSPLPKGIYRDSKVYYADSIARGEIYLAYLERSFAGSLRLVPNDGIVWPLVSADTALYLENLLVSRVWSHLGLGREMLTWAERQAAMRGKTHLRLDCFAENTFLRAYYETFGYAEMGQVNARYPFGTLRLQRYEKPV